MLRREFLGWLGTASVAAMSMGAIGGAGAQTPGTSGKPAEPAPPAPGQMNGLTPPGPDAHDLLSIAKRRYADHLSDEQSDELLATLDRGLQGSAALRKAKLANGDEPDFVFRAGE